MDNLTVPGFIPNKFSVSPVQQDSVSPKSIFNFKSATNFKSAKLQKVTRTVRQLLAA